MELTLGVLIDLAGELEDGSRASEKLREKLQKAADLEDIENLLSESLGGSETYHNRALQDIVNNIGERLGFEVDYGAYQPTRSEPSSDGLWVTSNIEERDVFLVAETKKSTSYTINPENQPGSYMDKLADEEGLDENQVYGIIIVGEDRNLNSIVHSVRGSQYRNRIRVITCQRLIELLSMMVDNDLSHEQVARVLLPMDTVNVGAIVELMNRIVNPPKPPSGGNGFWNRLETEAGIVRQDNGAVSIPESVNASEALRKTVGIAFDEGYMTSDDLPYTATGQSRYLINTASEHENGNSMRRPHEVRKGIWVECNRSIDDIERCVQMLATDFID